MKKILVPTDFSQEAYKAFDVATQLAHKTGAEITLLNVIDMGYTPNFSATGDYMPTDNVEKLFVVKMMEATHARMNEMKASNKYPGVVIKESVDVATIFNKVRKVVAEENIDLIVMGTQGASGLNEMMVGSNTEKVVRLAACPVLTIKSGQPDFNVKSIVFPSDFKETSSRALSTLKAFQELFGAQIHLVYVNTPSTFGSSKFSKNLMQEFAGKNNLQNYTLNIYNESVEETGILNFAHEVNADLIVMATHGRTGLSHLLSGSIAEDMVNHATIPILTCHYN